MHGLMIYRWMMNRKRERERQRENREIKRRSETDTHFAPESGVERESVQIVEVGDAIAAPKHKHVAAEIDRDRDRDRDGDR